MIPWWIQSILLVFLFFVVLAIIAERILLNNYNPYEEKVQWRVFKKTTNDE
jgi:hypothetical protein